MIYLITGYTYMLSPPAAKSLPNILCQTLSKVYTLFLEAQKNNALFVANFLGEIAIRFGRLINSCLQSLRCVSSCFPAPYKMSPDTLVEGKIKKAGILKDTHVRLKMKITIHNMFTCSIHTRFGAKLEGRFASSREP